MLLAMTLAVSVAGSAPPATPSAAPANVPDWSRGRNRGSDVNIEFYRRFADCIAYRWPALGEAVVAALPGSKEEEDAMHGLGAEAGFCLFSGRVRLENHWLRGAIAEQLLRRKRSLLRPSWLNGREAPQALRAKFIGAYGGRPLKPVDSRDVALRIAAHCAVGESRPLVEALMRTAAASRLERQALTQLNPTLSRCVAARDISAMGAAPLRAYLAEALYWRRALEGAA
jgi:hypothetical protein